MRFEWDQQKAEQNLAKHGVPFEYAARVFLDPHRLDSEDTRYNYREERRITVGRIEWRIYAVAYTMRGDTTRLISARKASQRERRRYYEALPA
jgi:uncharacterized DUF497 family protein